MKIKSKEECKAIADDVFKRYPKAQKIIVASDGQAFISDVSDLAAKNHSVNNRYKKELGLHTFLRDSKDASTGKKEKVEYAATAKDLIAQIEIATIVEAVQAILDAENATGAPRKGVLDAVAKKLGTLKTA